MKSDACATRAMKPCAFVQFGLAAATLEEIRGEAGQELEGRSEIGWLPAQHNLVPAPRNFHLLRAKKGVYRR